MVIGKSKASVVDRAADTAAAQTEPRFKRFEASATRREVCGFVVLWFCGFVVLRVRNNMMMLLVREKVTPVDRAGRETPTCSCFRSEKTIDRSMYVKQSMEDGV